MIKKIEDLIGNKTGYTLLGILLLGTILRIYNINHQSLWLDELHSIVPTDPHNSLQSVIEYCKGDQPPLFFIYIYFMFKAFGYNEIVGRMASALIGLTGIYAIFLLGKECFGKRAGIFAALLTCVNYFHIYYSQELRFYSMAFLFATLSYLFFIRAYKRGHLIEYIGYTFFTICLLYTHYYGIIIFGAQALTFLVLLIFRRDLKFLSLSISSGVVIAIAFIPWMQIIISDLNVEVGWIKKPDPHFVAQYFYDYTGKDIITTSILIIFLYLSVRSLTMKSVNAEWKQLFLILTIWIVITYLVPYVRSIILSPMLSNRYTIVILPAWIILFASGWDAIVNIKIKYAASLILVLSALMNIVFFRQHYTRVKNEQFREASSIVLEKNEQHHPIFSSLAWYYSFYFKDNPVKVKYIESADFTQLEKFWLLQAFYPEEELNKEIIKLSENFEVVESHSFFGANAILMARK